MLRGKRGNLAATHLTIIEKRQDQAIAEAAEAVAANYLHSPNVLDRN